MYFLSVFPQVLGGAAAFDAHGRVGLGGQPEEDGQGVVREDRQDGEFIDIWTVITQGLKVHVDGIGCFFPKSLDMESMIL